MKKCPFCAEDIQDAAIVCKHCGRDIKKDAGGATATPQRVTAPVSVSISDKDATKIARAHLDEVAKSEGKGCGCFLAVCVALAILMLILASLNR